MPCQITLAGESYSKKRLDFGHARKLTGIFEDLAYGSVNIRLNAKSLHQGKRNPQIERAAQVYLLDFDGSSQTFQIESDPLAQSLQGLQGDLFSPEAVDEMARETPLGLVVQGLRAGIDPQADRTWLDKPLLERMALFSKLLPTSEDHISILNEGSFEPLDLTLNEALHIAELQKQTPKPRRVSVSGNVDVVAILAKRIELIAHGHRVRVFLEMPPDEMGISARQQITVTGMAHYRANGTLLRVEADKVREARPADKAFERVARAETQRQQLERLRREKPQRVNPLGNMIGKWPGDETYEEIMAMLD